MNTSIYILYLLKTILVWPFAVFVLGIILIIVFKKAIKTKLENLKELQIKEQKYLFENPQEKLIDIDKSISPVAATDNPEKLKSIINELNVKLEFEKLFQISFTSQLEILDYLLEKEMQGKVVQIYELDYFYDQYVKRGGIISPTWRFLQFLFAPQLMERIGKENPSLTDSIKISEKGKLFLAYLRSEYGPNFKSFRKF